MQQPTAILSSAYFPPVQWMQKLNRHTCIIEQHDNYVKQTYRNRCIIAAANGPQVLTVPIERTDGQKCPMRDVRISDHGEWRHLHWNALVSAYGESPFFEFYADDIRPFFERKYEFLFDFNLEITHTLCRLLDVQPHFSLSEEYIQAPDDASADSPPRSSTTAKPSARSVLCPMPTSPHAPIIRCMPSATASCPTSVPSTCCFARGRREYSGCEKMGWRAAGI